MRLTLFGLIALFFSNICQVFAEDCPIEGTWKSNEEKTLANLEGVSLTKEQRKLFSKNFFGVLVVEVDCKGYTSIYEGERERVDFEKLEIKLPIITATYYDKYIKESVTKSIILNGDCYSVPVEDLGFFEVFCKVNN